MKMFKSYGFWTALAGAVVVLINAIGKCFGFSVEEGLVTDIIMAVAGVLVVFGIVSMPKKGETTEETEASEENAEEKESQEEPEIVEPQEQSQENELNKKQETTDKKNN